MFFVYALYSCKFKRIYIGHTKNIENRLKDHNRGKVKSTKPYIPFEVFYSEEYNTRLEAVIREKDLKSTKGRKLLRELIGRKSGEA